MNEEEEKVLALREVFAVVAMHALLTNDPKADIKDALKHADALIAALKEDKA